MRQKSGAQNFVNKIKILKEIDDGVNYSIIMAKYKLKSSANVSMIKKRGKEIEDALNFQFC